MSDVIIYTTTHCPYCHAVKELFQDLDITFNEINLDDKIELRQKLYEENNGWRTVPMIFIKDKFLGGYNDVKKLVETDEIKKHF